MKLKMQNEKRKITAQNSKFDLKTRAYRFALNIIKFIDELPRDSSTQVLAQQLLRGATSIGANIIEAQASSSRKDFTNFFQHSLKSANESKFWLGLLRDSGKASDSRVNPLLTETKEMANIIASSILTLKGKKRF